MGLYATTRNYLKALKRANISLNFLFNSLFLEMFSLYLYKLIQLCITVALRPTIKITISAIKIIGLYATHNSTSFTIADLPINLTANQSLTINLLSPI